jgi:hypothetical protein
MHYYKHVLSDDLIAGLEGKSFETIMQAIDQKGRSARTASQQFSRNFRQNA